MSKYKFLWSNAHQLFYMRGNIDSYIRYSQIPFNKAQHVFQVSHGNNMTCYLGTDDLAGHAEEGKSFLSGDFADQYMAKAQQQCAAHQEYFSKLKKISLSKQTNEQLLNLWRQLMDHYAHSVAYFRSTQEEPSRALVNLVAKAVSSDELGILLLSPEPDEINKESLAWQELVEKEFTYGRARAHLDTFPWLFQNVLSTDETIDELRQRASKSSPRDVKKEKTELVEKQAKVLSKHPAIVNAVERLHRLALLRPLVKAAWGSTGFYATPMLVEAAKRFGEDVRTLTFLYRHEDTEALLEKGKTLTEQEVVDRKKCTAYVIREHKLLDFVGEEAEQIEREELGERETTSTPVTEIRGMAARPGKVRGIVHILSINDPQATKKFRASFDSGILVTSMTQPNVVDIAERAAAIITDEGGMLCHAAIISREFGIPCVVGTHKATQVLREGDEVEVDANEGIIRILKSNEN